MRAIAKWIIGAFIVINGVLPMTAEASPFLVSNPEPQNAGGICEIIGPTGIPPSTPLLPDGSIRVDLVNAPVGVNQLQIRVCIDDPLWGMQCSDPFVDFAFERPGKPFVPGSIGIAR